MFQIAHISDLHLSPLPAAGIGELASKRILGFLNWHLGGRNLFHSREMLDSIVADLKAREPDHIAITGDIVNISLREEFQNSTRYLQENFDPADTTLVLGNHDAYVPGSAKKAMIAWHDFLAGDNGTLSSANQYPVVRKRKNVALVCINAARATAPFMATGHFGKKQAEKLAILLTELEKEGLCRVILIHFPPVHGAAAWPKRLVGLERFQTVIREVGAELILHGHTHLPTKLSIDGKTKSVPVFGVASASNAVGLLKPPAGYNVFTITGSKENWSIAHQEYGYRDTPDSIKLLSESLVD